MQLDFVFWISVLSFSPPIYMDYHMIFARRNCRLPSDGKNMARNGNIYGMNLA